MDRKYKRVIILVILGLLLLLVAVYGLLPWWLPKDAIKQKIEQVLQQEFERDASVGQVQISWLGGVIIKDVKINRNPDFGPGLLLQIDEIRCPFAPTDLLKDRLGILQIKQGRLFVVITPQGRVNILELPPVDIELDQVVIEDMRVNLENHRVKIKGIKELNTGFDLNGVFDWVKQEQGRYQGSFSLRKFALGTDRYGKPVNFPAERELRIGFTADYESQSKKMLVKPLTVTAPGLNLTMQGGYDPNEKADKGLWVNLQEGNFQGRWKSLHILGQVKNLNWALSRNQQKKNGLPDFQGLFLSLLRSGLEQGCVKLHLQADDLTEFQPEIQALTQIIGTIKASGPLDLQLSLGETGAGKIQGKIKGPKGSKWFWQKGDIPDKGILLEKNPGKELAVEFSGKLSENASVFEQFIFQAALDDNHLVFGPQSLIAWEEKGLKITGPGQVTALEEWLNLSPALREILKEYEISLEGDVTGHLKCSRLPDRPFSVKAEVGADNLTVKVGSGVVNLIPSLDADETLTDKPDSRLWFHKPKGQVGNIKLSISPKPDSQTLIFQGQARMGAGSVQIIAAELVESSYELTGWKALFPYSWRKINFQIDSSNLAELTLWSPRLLEGNNNLCWGRYHLCDLQGVGMLWAKLAKTDKQCDMQFNLEAGKSQFTLKAIPSSPEGQNEEIYWAKEKEVPFSVSGDLSLSWDDNSWWAMLHPVKQTVPPVRTEIRKLDWKLDNIQTGIKGNLQIEQKGWLPLAKSWYQRLSRGELNYHGRIDYNKERTDPPNLLQRMEQKVIQELSLPKDIFSALAGSTQIEGYINWDQTTKKWDVKGSIDLTSTGGSFELPAGQPQAKGITINKPIGKKLTFSYDLGSFRDTQQLKLHDFRIEMAQNSIQGHALLEQAKVAEFLAGEVNNPARQMEFTLDVKAPDLQTPVRWLEVPDSSYAELLTNLEGDLNLKVAGAWHFGSTPTGDLGQATLTGTLRSRWQGKPLEISCEGGQADPTELRIGALKIQTGENQLNLIVDVQGPWLTGTDKQNQHVSGRIDILAQQVDLDDLTTLWGQNLPVEDPTESMPSEQEAKSLLSKIRNFLHGWELNGSAHIHHFSYTDTHGDCRLHPQELQCQYQLQDGKADASYQAALSGGIVRGTLTCDLNQSEGTIQHSRESIDLVVDEALQPRVESEFPGLVVTGTISENYELNHTLVDFIRDPQAMVYEWSGTGTTVCRQGLLYGPGGPAWLLKMFPGLELIEYPWELMDNQYERFRDGSQKNRMRFTGTIYNIYINGHSTLVRQQADYEKVIKLLRLDEKKAREQWQDVTEGGARPTFPKRKRLEHQLKGLGELLEKYNSGKRLRIARAEYEVGVLMGSATDEVANDSRYFLQVPVFDVHGYIVGQFMVGTETKNIQLVNIRNENTND